MIPEDRPTIPTSLPIGSHRLPSGWQAPSVEQMQELLPQYEIMEILGRGGMGAVYKGRQKSLKRLVAIKILPPDVADDEMKFVERFQNEAQTMAAMNHPAIVAVYDFGETKGGLLYFIMEFVDGTDVQKMIQAGGKLSGEYALAITAHVCDALGYAHSRGVIHRDIKPANILIDQEGHIKVADFGLAKMDDPSVTGGLTCTNMAMGTPDYVAPEVLSPGMVADHRADLYAVGVMLYQMLTGEVPRGMFKLPSQKGIGSDPRFDEIICKAMEQDRNERYQSAGDVRRALDLILTTPQAKNDGTGIVKAKDMPQKPAAKVPGPPDERSAAAQKPPPRAAASQVSPKGKAAPKMQPAAGMWFSLCGIVAVLGTAGFLVLGSKPKPVAAPTVSSAATQPTEQAPITAREATGTGKVDEGVNAAGSASSAGAAAPWTDWLGPRLAKGQFQKSGYVVEKDGITTDQANIGISLAEDNLAVGAVRLSYLLRDSEGTGIAFRNRTTQELYVANDSGSELSIAHVGEGGKKTVLVSEPYPATISRTGERSLEFHVKGDTLKAAANGSFHVTAKDPALAKGPGSFGAFSIWKGLLLKKVEIADLKEAVGGTKTVATNSTWKPMFTREEDFNGNLKGIEFRDGWLRMENRAALTAEGTLDGAVRTTIRYHRTGVGSLTVRHNGSSSSCTTFISGEGSTAVIAIRQGNPKTAETKRSTFPLPFALQEGDEFTFEFGVVGDEFTVSVNGQKVGSVHDGAQMNPGRMGVLSPATLVGEFKNIAAHDY